VFLARDLPAPDKRLTAAAQVMTHLAGIVARAA
jgi:hypothetical protein